MCRLLHYKTRTGRSTSPAGNYCLDPCFGLSCVIGWVQPYCVEGFFGHDREAPYFGKSRVAACFGITCNHVIAITETGCDTGYLEIRCLMGLFDIIFDTVGLCLSCDTACHGKGCKTVSSSFRCLAVYMILAIYRKSLQHPTYNMWAYENNDTNGHPP